MTKFTPAKEIMIDITQLKPFCKYFAYPTTISIGKAYGYCTKEKETKYCEGPKCEYWPRK